MSTVIYLYRNDLRLHDNQCLTWAHSNYDYVIHLYCFDPKQWMGSHNFGFPKTAKYRTNFLIESVNDLRQSLKRNGTNLIVRHASHVDSIKKIIDECKDSAPVKAIVLQREVTSEELKVEHTLYIMAKHNPSITIQMFWGSTLYHVDDLPFTKLQIPNTYTEFRKSVESRCSVRSGFNSPDIIKPMPFKDHIDDGCLPNVDELIPDTDSTKHPHSAFPFTGGESQALKRIQYYLWESNLVANYKTTRNGLIGEDYSTKLSPWLGLGCVSPRYIHRQIKDYESSRTCNQSTYWVIFELLWRDYFKFISWKFGNNLFRKTGIMGKEIEWKNDMKLFVKWSQGKTGVPFVDANMRELLLTGWMSNRGRQNVASFLVKDLKLDWRLGAEWFESLLIDHDVCSNYGNWNYAAGIGNDPRENRKFNMIKQSIDYDPDGAFIKLWIPELNHVATKWIHAPWMAPNNLLLYKPPDDNEGYPKPMVIATEWQKHLTRSNCNSKASQTKLKKRNLVAKTGIDFYFKKSEK